MNTGLKKGDNVKILTGRDRGKTGKILEIRSNSGRVVVEGVSLVRDHRRPKKANQKGQIVTKPASLNISNVMLVCSSCGKNTRVAYKVSDNGVKMRTCKQCGRTT